MPGAYSARCSSASSKHRCVMEGWRVLNKLANLRIDQNKSGTTAFHAGKFFRFPAFFSDPTVNSLFSHTEAFSQFFGGHFIA